MTGPPSMIGLLHPTGFHDAAGEVYLRLAGYKDTPAPPSVEEAIAALLKRASPGGAGP